VSIKTVNTYVEAVEAFIDAAPWLGDADLPGVMGLRSLAKHLDAFTGLPQAALLSQFNMTFRDLRNREPKGSGGPDDALAKELAKARQPDLFEAAAQEFHRDNDDA
jgi:hypothetical protein